MSFQNSDYSSTSNPSASNSAPQAAGESNNHIMNGSIYHGKCLSYDDRENFTRMVDTLVRSALIPFVEAEMRMLNEQVIARRGLSKSLTSGVRKWFGAAASTQPSTSVTYVLFVQYGLKSLRQVVSMRESKKLPLRFIGIR